VLRLRFRREPPPSNLLGRRRGHHGLGDVLKVLPKVHSWTAFAHPKAPDPAAVRRAAKSISELQARGELKKGHLATVESLGLMLAYNLTTLH
jgi:hypothetical protein